jgi:hypothetical protein
MMERPLQTLKVKRVRSNGYSRQFEKTEPLAASLGQQSNHLTFKIKIMIKTATLFTSLLLILFVSTEIFAQLTSQKIDSLVENALVKLKVAGASVAIVKDGKVIHQKGYGLTSITTKEAVNEYTNFQIASNTKAFTTAALSILRG